MRRAFTLIEILVVVMILGLLAAMVIPQFIDVTGDAQRTAFINSGRIFMAAAKRYELDYGAYPDAAPGQLPDGFGYYIQSNKWEGSTPIGGVWDSSVNAGGVTAALGVFFPASDPDNDPANMQKIDEIYDDGDLATGIFRRMSNTRYFFVIAD